MDSPSTVLLKPPIPSPPATTSHGGVDVTPVFYILFPFGFIGVVIFIYVFFSILKCPPNPFERHRRRSGGIAATGAPTRRIDLNQLVSTVAYKWEPGGECPVCLTAFADGEAVRQVNVCEHVFHAACIEMWLCSHSNCPVCRAFIATAKSTKPPETDGEGDFRQGLPDSASLV